MNSSETLSLAELPETSERTLDGPVFLPIDPAMLQGNEQMTSADVDPRKYIFVQDIQERAAWQIGRIIALECGDDFSRAIRNIHAIKDIGLHDEVANHVFGDKLEGDIGARSTQGHPKTDYGEPRFGSGWDLDER